MYLVTGLEHTFPSADVTEFHSVLDELPLDREIRVQAEMLPKPVGPDVHRLRIVAPLLVFFAFFARQRLGCRLGEQNGAAGDAFSAWLTRLRRALGRDGRELELSIRDDIERVELVFDSAGRELPREAYSQLFEMVARWSLEPERRSRRCMVYFGQAGWVEVDADG